MREGQDQAILTYRVRDGKGQALALREGARFRGMARDRPAPYGNRPVGALFKRAYPGH